MTRDVCVIIAIMTSYESDVIMMVNRINVNQKLLQKRYYFWFLLYNDIQYSLINKIMDITVHVHTCAKKRRCSSTVSESKRISCWGQKPSVSRKRRIFLFMSYSPTRAFPSDGFTNPEHRIKSSNSISRSRQRYIFRYMP